MTVVTADSRRRLTEIRERTKDARKRMRDAEEGLALARKGGDQALERSFSESLARATHELSMAAQLENSLLSQFAGISGSGFDTETIFDDPAALNQLEQMAHSTMPVGNVNLGPIVSRDNLIAILESGQWGPGRRLAVGGDPGPSNPVLPDSARYGPFFGVVPQLRRRLRLLDLIPSQPMEGGSFFYAIESGSLDFAAETAEGSLKPQIDEDLSQGQVIAQTIAAYAKLMRQQLADMPTLQMTTANRLIYGVNRRVENQLVGGDGTGVNLLGILNTTGVGVVDWTADTPLTDLALDGIVTVLSSNAEPNAVVLNPVDYGTMLAAKAVGSGERLDSNGALSTPADTLWGLPLIVNTVQPVGQCLIGDFTQGCCLFIREGLNLLMSDSDQDDFVRNRVTLLAEGRFGFAVFQPACFALVEFASSGASGASGPTGP